MRTNINGPVAETLYKERESQGGKKRETSRFNGTEIQLKREEIRSEMAWGTATHPATKIPTRRKKHKAQEGPVVVSRKKG